MVENIVFLDTTNPSDSMTFNPRGAISIRFRFEAISIQTDDYEHYYGEIFLKGGDRGGFGGNKIVPKLCPSRSNISKWFQTKPKIA